MSQIDNKTLGKRIQDLREGLGMSRKQLGGSIGVSDKVIEKIEYGTADTSIQRLSSLATILKTDLASLIAEEETQPAMVPAESGIDDYEEEEPALAKPDEEDILAALADLDELREEQFLDARRHAFALADDIASMMRYMEARELENLARARGLRLSKDDGAVAMERAMEENFEEGNDQCCNLAERIIDTGFFGFDLHRVNEETLLEHYKQNKGDSVGRSGRRKARRFGFEDQKKGQPETFDQLVIALRMPLRAMAVNGEMPEM